MRVSTETACSRFIAKTFFYFVPEAVKGENNTFNKIPSICDKKLDLIKKISEILIPAL